MQYSPLFPHILVKKLPLPESTIIHIQRPKQLKCEVVDVYEGCETVCVGQKMMVLVHQLKPIADTDLGFLDVSEDGADVVLLG